MKLAQTILGVVIATAGVLLLAWHREPKVAHQKKMGFGLIALGVWVALKGYL